MEQVDYAPLLPTTPPEGLLEWLIKKGNLQQELLVYRAQEWRNPLTEMKEKCVELRCSKCGNKQLTAYAQVDAGCGFNRPPAPFGFIHPELGGTFISGNDTLCPMCGTEVTARHIGSLRSSQEYWTEPLTIMRLDNMLVLIGWVVIKSIDKEAKVDYRTEPYEAYVVEAKKIVRLKAYAKFMGSGISFRHNWTQVKQYSDVWGITPMVFPWDKKLLEGSTAENSKLDLFLKSRGDLFPVTYLRIWQKRPNIENLVVQGVGHIVAEMIETEYRNRDLMSPKPSGTPRLNLNWKENRPAQMLGLNKDEFNICRSMKWGMEDIRFYQTAKETGYTLKFPDEVKLCKEFGYYDLYQHIYAKKPFMAIVRYVLKQRRKCSLSAINFRYLEDYWRMAVLNGADLNNPAIRFPGDLKAAHDRHAEIERFRLAEEKKAKEAEKANALRGLFEKRVRELAPYAYELDGLLIRPAASYEEFIDEGSALDHCVAGYAERHAKGETALFWIRKTSAPDKPFFTLQFDEKKCTVIQNRGKKNRDRTPEVTSFELRWLEHARKVADERNKPKTKIRKKKEVTAA